jgi:CRISPR system Cascade subunit CasE
MNVGLAKESLDWMYQYHSVPEDIQLDMSRPNLFHLNQLLRRIEMYLTKLILNQKSYRVQKELSNPYQLHRTIMNAFPDNIKDKDRDGRILFRIDTGSKKPYPLVLIQSILCPNWDFLIKDDNYLLKDPLFKQFEYPEFKKGIKYWFRLFANPTKKVNGKRIGFYKEEDQFGWLKRKAKLSGFNLLYTNITRKQEIHARTHRNSREMVLYGIQFDGLLQIVNPKKFDNAMKYGIGSGKAFGFGFLTVSKF